MKVVVVGAGIGGLTFAVAARRRGFHVTLVEQRSSFPEEGAGIVLGPNVMAALAPLNLAEPIVASGRAVKEMRITDSRGHLLASSRYSAPDLPIPAQAIHRSRLHKILHDAFDGELMLGRAVERIEAGKVWLGDRALSADLVVGADGIRSRVREALHPGFTPRYSGTTCWRFVVQAEVADQVTEMWGVGQRLGVVPLGGGQSYVFLTTTAARRSPAPFTDLAGLRAHWSKFAQPGKGALDALADISKVLHNDLEDGIPYRWQAPGMVLLGDAAHAVTPNLGQGAGLAIEDACCLASLLETPAALERFETLRRPRATWIRDRSFAIGRVGQLESPWLCWLRDRAVAWTPKFLNEAALKRLIRDMPGVPTA